MRYFHTKVRMPGSSGPSLIGINLESRYRFRAVAMWLFDIYNNVFRMPTFSLSHVSEQYKSAGMFSV